MLRKSKKGASNKCPLLRFCLRELGLRITKNLSRDARRDLETTSAARRSYVHLRSELEEKLQAEGKADGQPTKQCDQRHGACCLRQLFGYRDRGGRDRRSGLDGRVDFHFFLIGRDGNDRNRLYHVFINRCCSNGLDDFFRRLRQLNTANLRIGLLLTV